MSPHPRLGSQPVRDKTVLHHFEHGFQGNATWSPIVHVPKAQYEVVDTPNGTKIVRGVKVFRAGTFKDSLGRQADWTIADLDAMVSNFNFLKNNQIFPDVPLREDHAHSVKAVGGYYHGLYRSAAEPDFLLADLEFTEPEVFDRFMRGTYRSRSMEVGIYEDNDGNQYGPAVMGLAFVDIPAVEGLHSKATASSYFSHYITDDPEVTPMDMSDPRWPAAVAYAQALATWQSHLDAGEWSQASAIATQLNDPQVSAISYASWLAAADYAASLPSSTPPAAPAAPVAPVAPAAAPVAPAAHGAAPVAPAQPAPQVQPVTFRINGGTTTDFAAVQMHIDTLEQGQREARDFARTSFVDRLVSENKILAPQAESFKTLVLGKDFSDAAFASFQAGFALAPTAPLLEQHGLTGGTGPAPAPSGTDDKLSILKEGVLNHKRANMDNDWLVTTPTYKNWVAEFSKVNGRPPTDADLA